MNSIIAPFGSVEDRVILERDHRGTIKVTAMHVSPFSKAMTPIEALHLILKFSADMLAAILSNNSGNTIEKAFSEDKFEDKTEHLDRNNKIGDLLEALDEDEDEDEDGSNTTVEDK